MAAFFKVLGGLGPVGRRGWDARARRELRGVSMSAEQERALAVYTDPRSSPRTLDGPGIWRATAQRLPGTSPLANWAPSRQFVVSAGEPLRSRLSGARMVSGSHGPRKRSCRFGTHRHPLHLQQPGKVTEAVLALLERAWDIGANGDPGRITC